VGCCTDCIRKGQSLCSWVVSFRCFIVNVCSGEMVALSCSWTSGAAQTSSAALGVEQFAEVAVGGMSTMLSVHVGCTSR